MKHTRKLGELGYQRSAKKCKEKFENVYKYHKRTKDSRSAKTEGKTKTYRFFDQLEAFESRFNLSHRQPQSDHPPKSLSQPSNFPPNNTLTSLPFLSRPSDHTPTTFSFVTGVTTITTANNTTIPSTNNPPVVAPVGPNANLSASTSSSTDSDEDLEERYRKKRKWKDYFRRLTRRVLAKQEEMQKRFLEAIDKRERERVAQQEAWRMQEMARINREHEILVQERSTAATKDAAIIAFLQKLSGGPQQPPPPPPPRVSVVASSQFRSQPPLPQQQQQQQQQNQQQQQLVVMPNNNITYEKFEIQKMNNNNHNINGSSGSGVGASLRWPTAEVHALIRLRTNMEAKYQENGPKAPLWEEISSEMQKLGYNRNSKRCKEKWENINKYFKKIKESNKQRREDSKTCPYYNELEALYKEKTKTQNNNNNLFSNSFGHNVEPLMVEPEQQWRPPTQEEEAAREYANHQYQEDDEEEDEGGVEEEYGEDGGSFDLENDEEAVGGRGGGRANGGDGGYENNNTVE